MNLKEMNIASFFSGVGGIELGFKLAGFNDPLYANELDIKAIQTYENNFRLKVDNRSICDVIPEQINHSIDIIMGGFPCQAFSIAGNRRGFDDNRGTLFFEMMRIIRAKQPAIVFAENVKNMATHDNGNTIATILEALAKENYFIKTEVLNAMLHGNVPQNRERIYIVAFKDEKAYKEFKFPNKIALTKSIRDCIDFQNPVDNKYYYYEGKYKSNIFEELSEKMDASSSIYQWRRKYVRKNQSNVIPTLTANQGEGGHNVCLIRCDDGRIRKMTPKECFNAQGFPKTYKLPIDVSDSSLYKQAGNSVCVEVVKRIALEIAKVI